MILCKDLYKQPGDVETVKGASMEIPDGMFLGLPGPNGAGETTLMWTTTGPLPPNTGIMVLDGQAMDRNAVAVEQATGITSRHVNLDKELTAGESMEFAGRLYRVGRADIVTPVDRFLSLLGLDSVRRRVTQNLSGEMKCKLVIAKSLTRNPRYLFLDEPAAGIDPNAHRDIWDFLCIQHKEGKTMLPTTHYIEEAQHLCDYVMLTSGGKILKEDTPKGLTDEIGPFKVEYEDGDRMKDKLFQDLLAVKARAGGIDALRSALPFTLEDVFFHYASKRVGGWK